LLKKNITSIKWDIPEPNEKDEDGKVIRIKGSR
jgi:hypothetical protein